MRGSEERYEESLRRLLVLSRLAAAVEVVGDDAQKWWEHVRFLATDEMRGRETGSAEHRRAAEYVAAQFEARGLAPGGTAGFLQNVPFLVRTVQEESSSLAILRDGKREPVTLGDEAYFSMRIEHAPEIEAPLVFVGYGLSVPEEGHDDLAGLDLKGKVALHFTGGPENIPGSSPGALPVDGRALEVPREGRAPSASSPSGIPGGRTSRGSAPRSRGSSPRWSSSTRRLRRRLDRNSPSPSTQIGAKKFFEGSGHDYAELLAAAQARKPLPRFPVHVSIAATVRFKSEKRESDNVVGILRGSDPKLS